MSALPSRVRLSDIAQLVCTAMDELRVSCAVEVSSGERRLFAFVGPPAANDFKVTVSIEPMTPESDGLSTANKVEEVQP